MTDVKGIKDDFDRTKMPSEVVGFTTSIDWIIDEFDSSFNDLAVASMRYHLDYSHCDNSDHLESWTKMIERLTEPRPKRTEEENAAIDTWDILGGGDIIYNKDGDLIGYEVPPCTPEARAAFESYEVR